MSAELTPDNFIIETEGAPGESTVLRCPVCKYSWAEPLDYTQSLADLRWQAEQHIADTHPGDET